MFPRKGVAGDVAGDLLGVVLFRQVHQHNRVRAMRNLAQKLCGMQVVEMPKSSTDAILNRGRVGSTRQHVVVVVRLDHKNVDVLQMVDELRFDLSKIGDEGGRFTFRLKSKCHLRGIVRNTAWHDFDVADRERRIGPVHARRRGRGESDVSSCGFGHEDRRTERLRVRGRVRTVIAMCVRDDNGVDVGKLAPQMLQARTHLFHGNSGVHKQTCGRSFDERAVAAASASYDRDAHGRERRRRV